MSTGAASVPLKTPDRGDGIVHQNIQTLLWQLRHEDPTQYNTLVKMHLSFATDMPTDQCDSKRNEHDASTRSSKWQFSSLIGRLGRTNSHGKGVMEGAPLTQEGVCQAFQLIHYLRKEPNITQEGLFRKTGSLTRQQELKSLLNSGGDLDLDSGTYSAHDCASVLKGFLAELPEPLLTEGHYHIHCKIAEMVHPSLLIEQKELAYSRQIKALRLLFLLLPPENFQLLQDLLFLINSVTQNQKKNKMSSINLGTIFAPGILCPRKMTGSDLQNLSGILSTAVAFMIDHTPQMFQIPLELEYDVRQYWSNKKKMRHQMSKRSMADAPTNTIFTFIDRELTAQANDKDVTEVALAELYAYVHSLPDSAKKRRLIKQFNHASGPGTPTLNHTFQKKQRSLSDSIKKHLFQKNVKGSKSKSQPFSSIGSVRVKRTNSEDLLSSPSSTRSPELRMFRRNPHTGTPDLLKAKSLDDLTSPNRSYLGYAPSSSSIDASLPSTVNPLFNPNSHYITGSNRSNLISKSSDILGTCLDPATPDHDGVPLSPLPITPFTTPFTPENSYRALGISNLTETGSKTPISSTLQFSKVEAVGKENSAPWNSSNSSYATPTAATPSNFNDADSPIYQAMMRSSIPQMVIMTPRSRCPIIVNSSSSLHNIPIPEETSERTPKISPVISNPAAVFLSPEPPRTLRGSCKQVTKSTTSLQSIEEYGEDTVDSRSMGSMDDIHVSKRSRWSGSSLRRTLSNASSSTTSLFGNFYRHLSTSSLVQLATRLTSHITLPQPEEDDDMNHEMMIDEDMQPRCDTSEERENEHNQIDSLNQSLSNVFKSYLISRSVLTENPIDLSMDDISADNDEDCDLSYSSDEDDVGRDFTYDSQPSKASLISQDSAYDSQPSSISASREVSKASLISQDSAVGLCKQDDLSESLLYCLDGNNPLSSSASSSFIEDFQPVTDVSLIQDNLETDENEELHSCSPNGRRLSILKNKQGTPVRPQDNERTISTGSARSVFFETSF